MRPWGLSVVLGLLLPSYSMAQPLCDTLIQAPWIHRTSAWLPSGWTYWTRGEWRDQIQRWTAVGAWSALQAAAYVLTACHRPRLAQDAWSRALHLYLTQGGNPAYAQDPQAFPWWRLWDAEFFQTGATPALVRRYMQGSRWTPNLWDRSLRSQLLVVSLRRRGYLGTATAVQEFEDKLAREYAPYRVAPLEWKAWSTLLDRAARVWGYGSAVWLALILVIGPRGRRTWSVWLVINGVVLVGMLAARAWFGSALETWHRLRVPLLYDGFIRLSLPPPWREWFLPQDAGRGGSWRRRSRADDPIVLYNRALCRGKMEQIPAIRRRAPFTIGLWVDHAPGRPIPIPLPWTALHLATPATRWPAITQKVVYAVRKVVVQEGIGWSLTGLVTALITVGLRRWGDHRGVRWVMLGLPGISRFLKGRPLQGACLLLPGFAGPILLVTMYRTSPQALWGSLLSPAWIDAIMTSGQAPLLLWGGALLTLWGLTLFAWTVHLMVFWIDTLPQVPNRQLD